MKARVECERVWGTKISQLFGKRSAASGHRIRGVVKSWNDLSSDTLVKSIGSLLKKIYSCCHLKCLVPEVALL
jgi:hypothetical protein